MYWMWKNVSLVGVFMPISRYEVCISALWHCCELLQRPFMTNFLQAVLVRQKIKVYISKRYGAYPLYTVFLISLIMISELRQQQSLSFLYSNQQCTQWHKCAFLRFTALNEVDLRCKLRERAETWAECHVRIPNLLTGCSTQLLVTLKLMQTRWKIGNWKHLSAFLYIMGTWSTNSVVPPSPLPSYTSHSVHAEWQETLGDSQQLDSVWIHVSVCALLYTGG